MSRPYTNLLIDLAISHGEETPLLRSITTWMSEDDVKQFVLNGDSREIAWNCVRHLGDENESYHDYPELLEERDYLLESGDM